MLSENQYKTLKALFDLPNHTLASQQVSASSALAEILGISASNACARVNRFADRGWIEVGLTSYRGTGHKFERLSLSEAGLAALQADPRFQLEQAQVRIKELEAELHSLIA